MRGKQPNLDDSIDEKEYMVKERSPTECADHGVILSKYCETCEECICEQCTIFGPHNDDSHWVQSADEAYQSRFMKLGFLIYNKLDERKKEIGMRLRKLDLLRHEVHDCRTQIDTETRQAFSLMIQRLDYAADSKLARLTQEAETLEEILNQANSIIQEVQVAYNSSPVYLMARIPTFRENINYLLTKNVKKEIDEVPYDLPRELYDLRRELEEMENFDLLVRLKNEII